MGVHTYKSDVPLHVKVRYICYVTTLNDTVCCVLSKAIVRERYACIGGEGALIFDHLAKHLLTQLSYVKLVLNVILSAILWGGGRQGAHIWYSSWVAQASPNTHPPNTSIINATFNLTKY